MYMAYSDGIGAEVARLVVDTYLGLSQGGKPTTRSNGVPEWTVLAGLVAVGDTLELLTMATGVKVLPDEMRQTSNGYVVHDCHAEVLCLRLFNWWLVEEMKNVEMGGESRFVTKGKKYKFLENYKLALYVSEPPCGDASMATGVPWDGQEDGLLRGRAHYNQLGRVRTKPGRADSRVSLSKLCSDKLCVKQVIGVNNAIVARLFDPIFLDYLVLQRDKYADEAMERCFGRVDGHRLTAVPFESDHYPHHKRPGAEPLPLSMLWTPTTFQVLNGGIKNGSSLRKNPEKAGSMVCNQALVRQALPFLSITKYSDLKRESAKREVRAALGWHQTSPDDFIPTQP